MIKFIPLYGTEQTDENSPSTGVKGQSYSLRTSQDDTIAALRKIPNNYKQNR